MSIQVFKKLMDMVTGGAKQSGGLAGLLKPSDTDKNAFKQSLGKLAAGETTKVTAVKPDPDIGIKTTKLAKAGLDLTITYPKDILGGEKSTKIETAVLVGKQTTNVTPKTTKVAVGTTLPTQEKQNGTSKTARQAALQKAEATPDTQLSNATVEVKAADDITLPIVPVSDQIDQDAPETTEASPRANGTTTESVPAYIAQATASIVTPPETDTKTSTETESRTTEARSVAGDTPLTASVDEHLSSDKVQKPQTEASSNGTARVSASDQFTKAPVPNSGTGSEFIQAPGKQGTTASQPTKTVREQAVSAPAASSSISEQASGNAQAGIKVVDGKTASASTPTSALAEVKTDSGTAKTAIEGTTSSQKVESPLSANTAAQKTASDKTTQSNGTVQAKASPATIAQQTNSVAPQTNLDSTSAKPSSTTESSAKVTTSTSAPSKATPAPDTQSKASEAKTASVTTSTKADDKATLNSGATQVKSNPATIAQQTNSAAPQVKLGSTNAKPSATTESSSSVTTSGATTAKASPATIAQKTDGAAPQENLGSTNAKPSATTESPSKETTSGAATAKASPATIAHQSNSTTPQANLGSTTTKPSATTDSSSNVTTSGAATAKASPATIAQQSNSTAPQANLGSTNAKPSTTTESSVKVSTSDVAQAKASEGRTTPVSPSKATSSISAEGKPAPTLVQTASNIGAQAKPAVTTGTEKKPFGMAKPDSFANPAPKQDTATIITPRKGITAKDQVRQLNQTANQGSVADRVMTKVTDKVGGTNEAKKNAAGVGLSARPSESRKPVDTQIVNEPTSATASPSLGAQIPVVGSTKTNTSTENINRPTAQRSASGVQKSASTPYRANPTGMGSSSSSVIGTTAERTPSSGASGTSPIEVKTSQQSASSERDTTGSTPKVQFTGTVVQQAQASFRQLDRFETKQRDSAISASSATAEKAATSLKGAASTRPVSASEQVGKPTDKPSLSADANLIVPQGSLSSTEQAPEFGERFEGSTASKPTSEQLSLGNALAEPSEKKAPTRLASNVGTGSVSERSSERTLQADNEVRTTTESVAIPAVSSITEDGSGLAASAPQDIETTEIRMNSNGIPLETVVRKEFPTRLVQSIVKTLPSAPQETKENWHRHRIVLDEGQSLQVTVRQTESGLAMQLSSANAELTRLLQQNLQEIRTQLQEQLEMKVDLEFRNPTGEQPNTNGQSTGGSQGSTLNNASLRGLNDAPTATPTDTPASVRQFGTNQSEWTA